MKASFSYCHCEVQRAEAICVFGDSRNKASAIKRFKCHRERSVAITYYKRLLRFNRNDICELALLRSQ